MPATVIKVKRAYLPPSRADGYRILVDRYYPRGLRRADARIDMWARDVAPSPALIKWYHAHGGEYAEFKVRYRAELTKSRQLRDLLPIIRGRRVVTLLYSTHDPPTGKPLNNATALAVMLRRSI